jgi:hypothetical protein
MNNDTPETITKEYKTYDECDADKQAQTSILDARLEQDLIAYSITCTGNSTSTK